MIDDAFQTGTDAALQDLAQRPLPQPKPQQRFSMWGTVSALPRGLAAATAEVSGSLADVVKAFGTVGAITAASDPVMMATANRDMLERERAKAKQEIDSGNLLTSRVGDSFRAASEYWQPDPVTAHMAENLVFDFTRVGGKVIGGAVAAGPIGVGFAAAEEGMTQSDRLRQQGVDLAARTQVGGVVGAATGIGAALPVAGSTLGRTAALVAVGGPGTFIAQQAATREILSSAGYADLASTYDPFDPVGLTVATLIPAAFGAHGLRSSRTRAAAEVRPVDAAAETAAVAPEQAPQMTPTAAAARAMVDRETVDAARVAYAVEQRRAGSLADPGDLRGAAMDDAAVARALDQMARGERVEVSDTVPQTAVPQVLARMNDTLMRLEETRAELVAQAEGLAERGQIREARVQLADLERQQPDTSPAAVEAVAREIQQRSDRKLLKTAMKEAQQLVDDRLKDWQGRVDRLNEIINRNAVAQKAVQDLPAVDRQLESARAAAEAEAANSQPAAAAARVMERLAAGDIEAAARIAQEAMNRPPGQLDTAQIMRPASEAPKSGGDGGAPTKMTPEAARLADIETHAPQALDAEIVTGWNDKGEATERMTARQYLDEVQRMASEEAADAQLLQVAAQCALRG